MQAEKDERVERRKEGTDGTEEEPPVAEAVLLERLDALEHLQQRLGNAGDSILAMTRNNAAGSALKRLKTEKEALEKRLEQVPRERTPHMLVRQLVWSTLLLNLHCHARCHATPTTLHLPRHTCHATHLPPRLPPRLLP